LFVAVHRTNITRQSFLQCWWTSLLRRRLPGIPDATAFVYFWIHWPVEMDNWASWKCEV